MSLAKVTFIKYSLTISHCGLCGGVAACYIKECVLCAVHTSLWSMWWFGSMLYQVHGGVCVLCAAMDLIQHVAKPPHTPYRRIVNDSRYTAQQAHRQPVSIEQRTTHI